MRKALMAVLMAATAVSTVAPAAAEAQERRIGSRNHGQDQRGEQSGERQAERQAPPAQVQQRRIGSPNARPAEPARTEARGEQRNWQGSGNQGNTDRRGGQAERREDWRNGQRGDNRSDQRNGNRNWNGQRIGDREGNRNGNWERRSSQRDVRDWSRSWRNDRRYDWQRYRYQNRNAFHAGRYYAPYRHNYSRFSIGFFLGQPFYGSRYWISDPWQYRLPPAYAGTRWVRYYDDVLLVDLYSGEVLDVIYDFFW